MHETDLVWRYNESIQVKDRPLNEPYFPVKPATAWDKIGRTQKHLWLPQKGLKMEQNGDN